ncbi:choice-of-anchor J domain-containing protein [Bizionia paragorgiae]|uniref:Uncharacterized protein n=1 Tax=Bizionia paragorgiae TaxID=283786 RepID=A0A1H3YRS1_BIZPA|nr:choice-of-anchor J domain-containing protein [Bizionia paragorgiae]SEA14233.1 protein of unknown function [Bizionia paragorgiae]
MKKIIYLLAIVGVSVLTGCNPLDDINAEIDAQANPVVGDDEYTLVSEDYAGLVEQGAGEEVDYYETFEAFSSVEDAEIMLPPFLSNKYPLWGQGSSVLVNFNLYDGNPSDVSTYVNADTYEFESNDYPTADANAFYPNENPDETVGNVLLNAIPSPEVGDVIRVQYKQFTEEPVVGFAPIIEYTFADSFEGWTIEEESGVEDVWTSNTQYVQGNGYVGVSTANEEWLVSPEIDLTSETGVKFQIAHAVKYADDPSLLKILVSTDYSGDVLTATWDEITLATAPGVDTLDPSEDYDFSTYDGQTVNIALKYESTITDSGRWRVGSLAIKTIGIEGDTLSLSDFYQFTEGGEWELVNNVKYLTSADYDSMGENSGQPGQYNNFSGSVSPNDYLPTFLDINYPFAQEEDSIYVLFKYYGGSSVGTVTKGNLYTVVNGVWTPSVASIQFGFDNGVWVPDNTVKYTLVGANYSYIASQLLTTEGYEAAAANLDSYGNFNRGTGASGWSDDMVLNAMAILLDNLYPDAEEGQKYLLTYNIYSGGNAEESMHLIKQDGEWVRYLNN